MGNKFSDTGNSGVGESSNGNTFRHGSNDDFYNGISTLYHKTNKEVATAFSIKWFLAYFFGYPAAVFLSLWAFIGDIRQIPELGSLGEPFRTMIILIVIGLMVFKLLMELEKWIEKRTANKEKIFDLKIKIAAAAKINIDRILGRDLTYFNEINKAVLDTYNRTKADRFLILKAYNGKDELKFVGVPYEQHKEKDHPLAYKSIKAADRFQDYEFDEAYRLMLKESEKIPYVNMIVEDMPDCDLKRIYQEEGVTHSQLFFLKRVKISEDKDEFYFCTFATHYGYFSPLDHSIIKHNFDSIKNKTKQLFN